MLRMDFACVHLRVSNVQFHFFEKKREKKTFSQRHNEKFIFNERSAHNWNKNDVFYKNYWWSLCTVDAIKHRKIHLYLEISPELEID